MFKSLAEKFLPKHPKREEQKHSTVEEDILEILRDKEWRTLAEIDQVLDYKYNPGLLWFMLQPLIKKGLVISRPMVKPGDEKKEENKKSYINLYRIK